MKTYYIVTKSLTFYINLEGKTFYQELAENLMTDRGFGSTEYIFSLSNSNTSREIDLTPYYNSLYNQYYK